ncbi:uncharacterized protein LOC124632934 [Helicoverpa zea]|uniref:uncharacterized protein LOC124632934 n=1 Tax=Helicoverpa zea TaxID=7113 RepID=UPI001F5830F2|nr:uncharacterized protein LOC124632934 [Helicoverpa zea]
MNERTLISLVQQYTELYDPEDPHYHDDQCRMSIWEEIGRNTNEKPLACKEKWKKIRENFRKAINLRKSKSEQGLKNFKPIRHGKELRFLIPYLEPNESEDLTKLLSISSDDEEEDSNITPPPKTKTVSVNKISKTKKTENIPEPENQQPVFKSYLPVEKIYTPERQEEKDPTVEFFKNLGETVKTFPPDVRVRVKRAVFSIVSEAEEEMVTREVGDRKP